MEERPGVSGSCKVYVYKSQHWMSYIIYDTHFLKCKKESAIPSSPSSIWSQTHCGISYSCYPALKTAEEICEFVQTQCTTIYSVSFNWTLLCQQCSGCVLHIVAELQGSISAFVFSSPFSNLFLPHFKTLLRFKLLNSIILSFFSFYH